MFLKVILYFRVFLFLVKMHFVCFFIKIWFRGCFARSSRLRASRKKGLREIFFHPVTQKLLQLYRDCIATNSFSRNAVWLKIGFFQFQTELTATVSRLFRDLMLLAKILCFSGPSRDCLATVSPLPNPQKTCDFSFI